MDFVCLFLCFVCFGFLLFFKGWGGRGSCEGRVRFRVGKRMKAIAEVSVAGVYLSYLF